MNWYFYDSLTLNFESHAFLSLSHFLFHAHPISFFCRFVQSTELAVAALASDVAVIVSSAALGPFCHHHCRKPVWPSSRHILRFSTYSPSPPWAWLPSPLASLVAGLANSFLSACSPPDRSLFWVVLDQLQHALRASDFHLVVVSFVGMPTTRYNLLPMSACYMLLLLASTLQWRAHICSLLSHRWWYVETPGNSRSPSSHHWGGLTQLYCPHLVFLGVGSGHTVMAYAAS